VVAALQPEFFSASCVVVEYPFSNFRGLGPDMEIQTYVKFQKKAKIPVEKGD
jgi:hypothetical protein